MRVDTPHRGGSGEPMLLVHGFTDTWRAWTRVLAALEEHHEVLVPTLPGHLGGDPMVPGQPIAIAAVADRLEELMDAAGMRRAHLVGSSLGGWLCLELAQRGRGLSVTGLCPAGGWEHPSREERAVLRYFRRNAVLLRVGRSQLARVARRPRLRAFVLRELVADAGGITAEAALQMFQGARGCTVVGDVLRLARNGAGFFGDLGPIDCPVRIVYGTRDRIIPWPGHYVRLRRMLPDAEFVALPGLGHLPMWEDPGLVARTILEISAAGRAVHHHSM
jgi:pimeloyl-ACP methyl ester carboxylesterase